MAFRKKWKHVIYFDPDVMIIQECESPQKFVDYQSLPNLNQFLWFGDNENKGVGVFTFNNVEVKRRKINTEFKYIIPLQIRKDKTVVKLFSIWAMSHKVKSKSYVGQLWNAFNYYRLFSNTNYMIVGDWNSHIQWDNERKSGNHSMLISKLRKRNIESLYHHLKNIEQGNEDDPTFYLLKNKNKPYHLDYCAVSRSIISANANIKIGQYDQWIKYSDHMPLFVSLS